MNNNEYFIRVIFYSIYSKSRVYNRFNEIGFSGIAQARQFAFQIGKPNNNYSITATAAGIGSRAHVDIIKTKAYYDSQILVYNETENEFQRFMKIIACVLIMNLSSPMKDGS